MKKVFFAIIVLMWTVTAFSQGSLFKQTLEIVEVEINDGEEMASVFDMPEDGKHQYFLCVGTLGVGDDVVQLQIDPVFQLFIPLGNTLEEAQAKLEEFKAISKQPTGTEMETIGTLALGNPSLGEMEPVYVTSQRVLFQRKARFSIRRNGYVRATYLNKGTLRSLASGVKFYKKLHPNEN